MKLRETISWLMGTLQRSLFPYLEECSGTPLTEKQKQLIQVLEIVQIERSVPKTAANQWMGRKIREREAIARGFVAKVVYNYPTTRSLINVRVRGYEKVKLHLMFGVMALFADHLIKLVG